MNLEDWKTECKRLIYEQEKDSEEGLTEHNLAFVDDWDFKHGIGMTPEDAVYQANEDAQEQQENDE